jgi:hypothetical protein
LHTKNQNFAASIGLHAGRFLGARSPVWTAASRFKTETPLAGSALAA